MPVTTLDDLEATTAAVASFTARLDAPAFARGLGDDGVLTALRRVGEARKALDLLTAALSSEVDRRSTRDRGYDGLAQATGFRNATSLIQNLTGQTAADIRRTTAAGNDLAASSPVPVLDPAAGPASIDSPRPVDAAAEPWFAPLTRALREGSVSREQYEAIRHGLGEPPAAHHPAGSEAALGMWRDAAIALLAEAADQTVEDLRGSSRMARDSLDPVGARIRWENRRERRSFRMWIDEDGVHNGRFRFDDDGAAWFRTVMSASLRPRRGPRFVSPEDAHDAPDAPAEEDSRSNEQLQYDTAMAIFIAGAQADPATAFGDRQPGVRILIPATELDRGADENHRAGEPTGVGVYEETRQAVPVSAVMTYLCDAGVTPVIVDGAGAPLNVGRTRRLFTAKQRVALSVRDGGCVDCGAEASRCEAHHIDEWWRHSGRTDLHDGVLLCRNCHLRVHNTGARIRRAGDEYWLHPGPAQAARGIPPRRLRSRAPTRFLPLGV